MTEPVFKPHIQTLEPIFLLTTTLFYTHTHRIDFLSWPGNLINTYNEFSYRNKRTPVVNLKIQVVEPL